ncbi:unnamed protein product [Menidia menidia]|uniref:(Atlantic silverside) hypothetical protein n=1 Tax=Menidia menidia TaxID=238744 RepID=A0A8S4B803_9TELE|nr:unnamed protein product [Menidia menidia]
MVATAAGDIERLLDNRSQALKRLAAAAERLQKEHKWMDNSNASGIKYYNAKDGVNLTKSSNVKVEEDETKRVIPDDFEFDPDFKRLVSYNSTAVHIPTDIFEGSAIILNELNWTEALDDLFRKNKEEDPSLRWQVFGSATGMARYFPASPWIVTRDSVNIDLYDVRRQPWYIQGAASPKDMLILVDASGSVSGLTLKLIKTSVSKMLETLADDDFVNVVSFNKSAKPAACFENLVQANIRNKKVLKDGVQRIKAEGITNYTSGFELAFQQLAQVNISRANCNKIIMLFTDGGEERGEEIFKKFNPKGTVRIFTFSVGQHSYDKGPIQWMACANKGYYYEIPSIGAIRINTQEYLDILGRPMVRADRRAKQVQWTNVYPDALELGLVITGTLPVFNKTDTGSKKTQNQLILGVMAVDVSLEDIKKLTPRFTFGPNGYYFAMDPNGYVVLHPNLQPANPTYQDTVTLDFLDAELENDIKVEIRKKMIEGHTGNYTISTLVKSQDERYIDQAKRTYTFAPVKLTDYSLALVLPEYSKYYIRATIGDTITQAKFSESLMADKFDEYGYTLIAPRMYCKDLNPPNMNTDNTEFLMEFNSYIDTKTPNNPMCDVELVNRLLLDAGITSDLIKIWKKNEVQNIVVARFVATDGGITRVFPKSAGLEWTEEAETYESSFYKRSLDNDLYIFTPKPFNKQKENSSLYDQESDNSVLVSRVVNLKIDDITLKPAVVGVKLDIDIWKENLINITTKMNCKEEICGCGTVKFIDCIILDDGGFLVMSNQDEYNSQPTIADILSLGWWATAAAWSIVQQLLVSITFPNFMDAAEMEEEVSASGNKEACITEQTQFFFETDTTTFKGMIECGNCSRAYHAEKLPKTNLVFIITDPKDLCTCSFSTPLIQEEHPSDGPDPCITALNPRYRKGPAVCFDNNEHEEDPDCGGVACLTPSVWLTLALQLVLFWVVTDSRHHAIPS